VKALVTGHCGFIGWHFKTRLEADGWDVDGCDIAATNARDARDLFRHAVRRYDLAVHCAAVVGGRHTIENAPLDQAVNLELDAGLFQWALRTRPGRVIYFSSSAVYPVDQQSGIFRFPLTEDMIDLDVPRQPDELYGWVKLTGERLACLARREGVPVTVVRPFSGYGEHQDIDYPFGAFADRARNREDPFTIWGDGYQARDFVHVDDVVDATLAVAESGTEEPVNIGWGEPVTMMELAQRFTSAAGYTPGFKLKTTAPAGVSYRVADPARMRKFYQPRVTLDEGIRRALRGAELHEPAGVSYQPDLATARVAVRPLHRLGEGAGVFTHRACDRLRRPRPGAGGTDRPDGDDGRLFADLRADAAEPRPTVGDTRPAARPGTGHR
jgi:nucleoside-diphosphate-sugar epimerase